VSFRVIPWLYLNLDPARRVEKNVPVQ